MKILQGQLSHSISFKELKAEFRENKKETLEFKGRVPRANKANNAHAGTGIFTRKVRDGTTILEKIEEKEKPSKEKLPLLKKLKKTKREFTQSLNDLDAKIESDEEKTTLSPRVSINEANFFEKNGRELSEIRLEMARLEKKFKVQGNEAMRNFAELSSFVKSKILLK